MIRLLLGLLLGAAGAAVTWAVTDDPGWTTAIGLAVAVSVWLGRLILDDLL
ncbi:hypothetical protein [Streptomyces sp. SHP 1-2]|uniref:hypothetical protein n=1 Tax=Streptomyces sp. SHP 1-2 TaxID=2769489 RepID=UPI00223713AB|nr:hypothetical protein [Streptomyces sp. SHP 1-2]MCW5252234.1 hypothetical protein [Streptomyces sp. SHP 1-2]